MSEYFTLKEDRLYTDYLEGSWANLRVGPVDP